MYTENLEEETKNFQGYNEEKEHQFSICNT